VTRRHIPFVLQNPRVSCLTPKYEKEFNVAYSVHFPFCAFSLEQMVIIGIYATQTYQNTGHVQNTVTSALITVLFGNVVRIFIINSQIFLGRNKTLKIYAY
jgi:hypothetical protein